MAFLHDPPTRAAKRRGRLATAMATLVVLTLFSPARPASATTAPTTPELISPEEGEALYFGEGQLFTVQSTDPQGDAYKATIEVTAGTGTTTFDTLVSPSGSRATGTPSSPILPGVHAWRARSTDLSGNTSAWSLARTFAVDPPPNTGAGQGSGDVTYDGDGQPGVLQNCAATTFTLSPRLANEPTTVENVSSGIIINIAGSRYVGPFTFTGGGTGDCANATAGSGTLHADVTGRGPTGSTLDCSVTGRFARVLSAVDATMTGPCTINNFATGTAVFRVQALFRPDPGQGLTTPVRHAIFLAYFTVTTG